MAMASSSTKAQVFDLRISRSRRAMVAGRAGRASVELGEDLRAEDVNPFELVAADVVQVDAIEAEVDEFLDLATMRVQVRRDQHAALEVFGAYQFGHSREVIWRSNVGLGELHPAIRPVSQRVAHRLFVGASP